MNREHWTPDDGINWLFDQVGFVAGTLILFAAGMACLVTMLILIVMPSAGG